MEKTSKQVRNLQGQKISFGFGRLDNTLKKRR
jgi:hypothetical protein